MHENIDNIIGKLLNGTISPEEYNMLRQQMADDPELNETVEELQLAQEVEHFAEAKFSGQARIDFENRLNKDVHLMNALQKYRAVKTILQEDQRKRYVDLFEQLEQQNNSNGKRSKWPWILATILLVAAVIPFIRKTESTPSLQEAIPATQEKILESPHALEQNTGDGILSDPNKENKQKSESERQPVAKDVQDGIPAEFEQLLRENTKERFAFVPLKGNNLNDSLHLLWRTAYADGDFNKVIDVVTQAGNNVEEPEQAEWLLGSGLAQFYLSNYVEAVAMFDQILAKNFNRWQDPAQWYKALALFNLDKGSPEARQILQEISTAEEGHDYRPQARTLLDKLKR